MNNACIAPNLNIWVLVSSEFDVDFFSLLVLDSVGSLFLSFSESLQVSLSGSFDFGDLVGESILIVSNSSLEFV